MTKSYYFLCYTPIRKNSSSFPAKNFSLVNHYELARLIIPANQNFTNPISVNFQKNKKMIRSGIYTLGIIVLTGILVPAYAQPGTDTTWKRGGNIG